MLSPTSTSQAATSFPALLKEKLSLFPRETDMEGILNQEFQTEQRRDELPSCVWEA